MNADEHESDRSGLDLDVWGGEVTTPVLIPKPGETCILQNLDGTCPYGCCQCTAFAETMKMIHHRDTEDTKNRNP